MGVGDSGCNGAVVDLMVPSNKHATISCSVIHISFSSGWGRKHPLSNVLPFYLVCALSYSWVKEKEKGVPCAHTHTLARNHLPSDVRLCLCISSSSFSLSLISSNGIITFIDPLFTFLQIPLFCRTVIHVDHSTHGAIHSIVSHEASLGESGMSRAPSQHCGQPIISEQAMVSCKQWSTFVPRSQYDLLVARIGIHGNIRFSFTRTDVAMHGRYIQLTYVIVLLPCVVIKYHRQQEGIWIS